MPGRVQRSPGRFRGAWGRFRESGEVHQSSGRIRGARGGSGEPKGKQEHEVQLSGVKGQRAVTGESSETKVNENRADEQTGSEVRTEPVPGGRAEPASSLVLGDFAFPGETISMSPCK